MNDMRVAPTTAFRGTPLDGGEPIGALELMACLGRRWKLLAATALLGGVLAFGIASLLKPTFTARTTLLPPQQQQSAATAALAQIGALAGMAGGVGGLKNPTDQYVALLQSTNIADRLIDEFKLLEVYEAKFREDARRELAVNSRIAAGKRDGLLSVEVDDHDPKRAAAMANAYVEALRQLTNTLAVSEAQQRRAFFEQQLQLSKERLTKAQVALQGSGFNPGALKAEPKAAAESYARLRAETTNAEIRLQSMRLMLADNAPELLQQQATLATLRDLLAKTERKDEGRGDSDYISKFREFKYQETLFDLFARQYELARVDESREGALIQVVDRAAPPEKKSKPRRAVIALYAALATLLLVAAYVMARRVRAGPDGGFAGVTA